MSSIWRHTCLLPAHFLAYCTLASLAPPPPCTSVLPDEWGQSLWDLNFFNMVYQLLREVSLPASACDRTVPVHKVTLCAPMLSSTLPARPCEGRLWSSTFQIGSSDPKCWHSSQSFVPGHSAGCCLFAQMRIKPSFLPEILENCAKSFYFSILDIFVILFFRVHLCHWSPCPALFCCVEPVHLNSHLLPFALSEQLCCGYWFAGKTIILMTAIAISTLGLEFERN